MYLERSLNMIKSSCKDCNWQFKIIPNRQILLDTSTEEVIHYIENINNITGKISWNKNNVKVSYFIPADDAFISKGFTQFMTAQLISGLVVNIFSETEREILFSLTAHVNDILDWNIDLSNEAKLLELKVIYDISNTKVF